MGLFSLIKLTHIRNGTEISDIEILPGQYTIGRAADNSLQLDDKVVSGHHAVIIIKQSAYMESIYEVSIKDLNSTNGIYINGKQFSHKKLKHNDTFQIGNHIFKIYDAKADVIAQTEFYITV